MKSQGKKLHSPQILEEPEELPDNVSGESSTLEAVKQESVPTCATSTAEDGDAAVIEEVRLEDLKVRSRPSIFLLLGLSELSYVLLRQDFKLCFYIHLWHWFDFLNLISRYIHILAAL